MKNRMTAQDFYKFEETLKANGYDFTVETTIKPKEFSYQVTEKFITIQPRIKHVDSPMTVQMFLTKRDGSSFRKASTTVSARASYFPLTGAIKHITGCWNIWRWVDMICKPTTSLPPKLSLPQQSEADRKAVAQMLVYDGTK